MSPDRRGRYYCGQSEGGVGWFVYDRRTREPVSHACITFGEAQGICDEMNDNERT